ncbi:hypothetical protein H920_07090 [Fukomys damarensis]|uniref:Uncharacterized protein n=1 Tax=Fukomys damarensis TaxID=885580 RepID=A0A091DLZ5_FUKDA|nr:hypothetical protein H920_07090 [Fukomys damarensis]
MRDKKKINKEEKIIKEEIRVMAGTGTEIEMKNNMWEQETELEKENRKKKEFAEGNEEKKEEKEFEGPLSDYISAVTIDNVHSHVQN